MDDSYSLDYSYNVDYSYSVNDSDSVGWMLLFSAETVNQFYTPLLCLFGAMGNCLSVSVFCMTSHHRSLSSSFYLSALAISDTGFLISLLAIWLDDLGFDIITSGMACPLVMYLGQVTCFLSVWLTVAFTVERFFAVCYPLTRPAVCTVERAKKVIAGLTVVAIVVFSYVWVIAQTVKMPLDSEIFEETADAYAHPNQNNPTLNSNLSNHIQIPRSLNLNPSPTVECKSGGENCGKDESFASLSSSVPNNGNASGSGSSFIRSPVLTLHSKREFQTGEQNNSESQQEQYPDGSNRSYNDEIRFVRVCSVPPQYYNISTIANYLDSFFTLILPFFIISFFNMRIAICVWKLKDERESIVAITRISQQQKPPSTRLKDHLNQSISSRRGSKNKLLFKNTNHNFTANGYANNKNLPGSSSAPTGKLNNKLCAKVNFNTGLNGGGSAGVGTGSNVDPNAATTSATHNSTSNNTHYRGGHGYSSSSSSAAERRVTKTLLLVSTVFLCLNLPSHAIRAASFIQSLWGSKENSIERQAAQQWSNILFNTNFAVNFLLYCVSGRNFRKALRKICFGRRGRRPTIRLPKSKSNRTILNNANSLRRENNLLSCKQNPDRESFFAAVSCTEVEIETTYA